MVQRSYKFNNRYKQSMYKNSQTTPQNSLGIPFENASKMHLKNPKKSRFVFRRGKQHQNNFAWRHKMDETKDDGLDSVWNSCLDFITLLR